MKSLLGLVTVVIVLLALPNQAHAQRRGRSSGVAPGMPGYNFTSSPEWRQAGGNYGIYLQLMEQKAIAAQQKQMQAEAKEYQKQFQAAQKQQVVFDKWVKDQKAKKAKGQPVDPGYQQMLDEEARYKAAEEARLARIAAKKAKTKPKKSTTNPKAETPAVEKTDEPKK